MPVTAINANKAPKAVGPYVHANRVDNLVFTSGQLPLVPETGELPGEGIEEQSRQALDNLKEVLIAAGSGLDKVIKTTVFITDMAYFAAFNAIYAEYFPANALPARSALACAGLAKGALVEVEAIALISDEQ